MSRPGASVLGTALGASLALVAAGVYLALRFSTQEELVLSIDRCKLLFCDFRLMYRPMGLELFERLEPVEGFYYSPAFALFLAAGFSGEPLEDAVWRWGLLQVGSGIALLALSAAVLARRARWGGVLVVALFATALPLLHNWVWGQVSVLLLALSLAALAACARERAVAAALLLALATCVKYTSGLFALYFVLRGDRRALAWYAAFLTALLVGLPAAGLSPEGVLGFYAVSFERLGSAVEWARREPNSQYAVAVLHRLAWPGLLDAPGARRAVEALGVAVALANAAALWRLLRVRELRDEPYWAFALIALATPFLVPTSWPHYFSYLSFVHGLCAVELVRGPAPRDEKAVAWALLWGPSVLLTSVFALDLAGGWTAYAGQGALFFANLLALALVHLCVARRAAATPGVARG